MRGVWPVLLVVVGGCYSYVAVRGPAPADGADVQVELVTARDVVLQDVTVHGITALQGRLLAADADSLAVAVARLWGQEGRTYEATGIGVSLLRHDVATVREKRASPARSALAIAVGGAGIVATILGVRALVGSSGGSTRPPPPP
jgi:hypothetical protein